MDSKRGRDPYKVTCCYYYNEETQSLESNTDIPQQYELVSLLSIRNKLDCSPLKAECATDMENYMETLQNKKLEVNQEVQVR